MLQLFWQGHVKIIWKISSESLERSKLYFELTEGGAYPWKLKESTKRTYDSSQMFQKNFFRVSGDYDDLVCIDRELERTKKILESASKYFIWAFCCRSRYFWAPWDSDDLMFFVEMFYTLFIWSRKVSSESSFSSIQEMTILRWKCNFWPRVWKSSI